MRLMSYNLWAGKEFDKLIDYLSSHEKNIDVFCFQEVFDTPCSNKVVDEHYRANLFSELCEILPNHSGYFAPAQEGMGFNNPQNFPIAWGIAMFIRKSIRVRSIKEVFIKGYKNSKSPDNTTNPRNLQYVNISVERKEYNIAHFHGLWNGKGKTDTDERIEQSKKARAAIDKKNKLVLCGDFNLLPDTESLAILEDGLINLIKNNNLTSTRSKLYEKPGKFADYTLVSKDINVNSFEVPEVEASDHLPMILDFN